METKKPYRIPNLHESDPYWDTFTGRDYIISNEEKYSIDKQANRDLRVKIYLAIIFVLLLFSVFYLMDRINKQTEVNQNQKEAYAPKRVIHCISNSESC